MPQYNTIVPSNGQYSKSNDFATTEPDLWADTMPSDDDYLSSIEPSLTDLHLSVPTNNYKNLPTALTKLKEFPHWVCYGRRGVNRKDKQFKVPIDPKSTHSAKSDSPNTWATYSQAVEACDKHGFHGLGFMFYPQNIALVGVDIDHCIADDGTLSQFATNIMAILGGYWEVSPSGTGLHSFILGDLPGDKRRKDGFEMYATGRYFTVTGNQWAGSANELAVDNGQLKQVYDLIFGADDLPTTKQSNRPAQPTSMADADIINKAKSASNGAKFSALWDGDTSANGNDHSAADMALCGMLAFWTGKDASKMDSLFRQSGLMRPKWDEMRGALPYGTITINKAIDDCGEIYTNGNGAQQSRPPSRPAQQIDQQGNDFVEGLSKDDAQYLVHGENDSDDGNADCVINWYSKVHDGIFLHTKHYGWLYWTGSHWENEDAEYKVRQAVLFTIRSRYLACIQMNATSKAKMFRPTNALISSTVAMMTIKCNANVSGFDIDPDGLNCKNGVVNLRTGKLIPHNPSQRFTYCIQTAYNPQADMGAWVSHIEKTFIPEGEPITPNHTDLINYIKLGLGYTITGRASEEMMFYVHGATRAGKGVLFQALSKLLGKPFAMAVNLSSLTRKRTGNDQNFDLAPLKPARFVTVSESDTGRGSNLNENAVKGMTGQDPIRCCFKGKDHFEYIPMFKIWMASNSPIRANADDNALWARVKVLHAPNSFVGREDTKLKDKLMSAKPMEGILRWLVEGARGWYKFYDQGLKLPTPLLVQQATNKAQIDNDIVGLFLEETFTANPDEIVTVTQFYNLYRDWCNANGYTPKMSRSLAESMENKNFRRNTRRVNGIPTKVWEGLALNN